MAKDVGARLREALKMQLSIIHERIEAKKIAKMALAEVRNILAKEEEEKLMDQKREETRAKAWERVEARLKEEDMSVEREMEKAKERAKKERDDLTEREEVRKQNKEEDEWGENLERENKVSMSKVASKGHSKSKKKSSKSSV
ncbi:inner centromere protein-like [Alosa sapidissima]|uniref:inner centromere protein-like n=1 Tax=Alosa sapidissima TaxID=34773 RepID=UPI001C08AAAB|nr:inner centromere protein-like [Alosa sapidissima]